MNSDNMALSGETIDFGPCAFLDAYDLSTVFSSIDAHGRYAYANQPDIAHWNLARLAESLLPLLDPKPDHAIGRARELLDIFPACTPCSSRWIRPTQTPQAGPDFLIRPRPAPLPTARFAERDVSDSPQDPPA